MKKLIILGIILSPLFVCGQSETINVSGHGEGLFINNSADSAGTYITLTDYNGKKANIVSFDDNYPTSLYNNALMLFARNGKDMRFATSTDAGAGANRFVIKNNGLVGVGTDDPLANLEIRGSFGIKENPNSYVNGDVRIYNHTGTTWGFMIRPWDADFNGGTFNWNYDFGYREDVKKWYAEGGFIVMGNPLEISSSGDGRQLLLFSSERAWAFQQEGSGTSTSLALKDLTGGKKFKIRGYSGEEAFYVQSNTGDGFFSGNVGLGVSPLSTYKLAIAGKAIAEEVVVQSKSLWPDYVFEEHYQLQPLSDLEAFFKKHKHLPDVPTATEVAQNGLKLGEMDALLLKKIEELTLYVIELKKENEQQEALIQELIQKE